MRRIADGERRQRLAARHHLAVERRAADVERVAGDIVGLHATDPATVALSAWARLREPALAAIEDALYVRRSLLRMLGMRRTMFVVPLDLASLVQASCTRSLVPGERRRFVILVEAAGIASDGSRWLAQAEQLTLRALQARGGASAAELAQDVPALREKIAIAQDKPYAGTLSVSRMVLSLLAADAKIVRGRPQGSWTSTLYRWVPIESWLPGGLAELDTDAAAAELVRRWLASFGPGTMADMRWWTGWSVARLERALARVDTVAVQLDNGEIGLVLAGDDEPVGIAVPTAALLPALDPAPMGYKARDWYLGEHRERLFDRSGNIGPTVWWEGHIVGGWAQRNAGGEIVLELLEDVGTQAATAIEAEAARLQEWLGDLRVTPRFRTPLERELAG